MKRYFIVHAEDMPDLEARLGEWHSIDLGSHGVAGAAMHVVVLLEDHIEPPASWEALPSLLDSRTTLGSHGKAHDRIGADVGLKWEHTAYDAATQLATIHPRFRP